MNIERTNQIFMSFVNVAVLVSVILLIFELRQNQEIAIAQTRNDISRQAVEQSVFRASDDIASIIVKAGDGGELSEVERYKLNSANQVFFQIIENIVYQHEKGMYAEDEFEVIKSSFSGMRQYLWEFYWNRPEGFSRSLNELMNEARIVRESGT